MLEGKHLGRHSLPLFTATHIVCALLWLCMGRIILCPIAKPAWLAAVEASQFPSPQPSLHFQYHLQLASRVTGDALPRLNQVAWLSSVEQWLAAGRRCLCPLQLQSCLFNPVLDNPVPSLIRSNPSALFFRGRN
jgi:hypothetical protein